MRDEQSAKSCQDETLEERTAEEQQVLEINGNYEDEEARGVPRGDTLALSGSV